MMEICITMKVKIEQKKIAISIEEDDDDLINGRGGMDITNSR